MLLEEAVRFRGWEVRGRTRLRYLFGWFPVGEIRVFECVRIWP